MEMDAHHCYWREASACGMPNVVFLYTHSQNTNLDRNCLQNGKIIF